MAVKIQILSTEERAASRFTHKAPILYTDVTGGTLTGTDVSTVALTGSLPVGTYVKSAGFKLDTAFDASDSAINSCLMTVGDDGDVDRFIVSKELAVDGTEILYWITANVTTTLPYVYTTANTIDAVFTVAGGASPTIAELNAGQVTVYLEIGNFNES